MRQEAFRPKQGTVWNALERGGQYGNPEGSWAGGKGQIGPRQRDNVTEPIKRWGGKLTR
jgi:hypothetical protein